MIDLVDCFEQSGGWGLERAFSKWIARQPCRQVLPPVLKHLDENVFEIPNME